MPFFRASPASRPPEALAAFRVWGGSAHDGFAGRIDL